MKRGVKILHTSDWHLGQLFIHRNRKDEQAFFLSKIIEVVIAEKIDIILVAGDIFDTGYPPNYALTQYYEFLRQIVKKTPCRHIVITGGNHDSPSTLNAPRELLRFLDVQVVGCVEKNNQEEINLQHEFIELKNNEGKVEAIVFAVPYLRDRDLKTSIAGETASERAETLKEAIQRHYQEGGFLAQKYAHKNIPILTTGHLFAAGLTDENGEHMERQDAENDIHIGNLGRIEANIFPHIFSYVALGHIHKAQKVGGKSHIRYSGSPMPLSFSECQDKKSVVILEYHGAKLTHITRKTLPQKRQLLRFSGTYDRIKQAICQYQVPEDQLHAWAEIRLNDHKIMPDADEKLKKIAFAHRIEILKVTINRQTHEENFMENHNLEELSVKEVFLQKCKATGITNPEILQELQETFDKLQTLIDEQETL